MFIRIEVKNHNGKDKNNGSGDQFDPLIKPEKFLPKYFNCRSEKITLKIKPFCDPDKKHADVRVYFRCDQCKYTTNIF